MDENKRDDLIIALYKQAMEDIRGWRNIEWQTFIAVNLGFGFALKMLYDYDGKLTPFYALVITTCALIFTYIWYIRVYGIAMREHFSRELRNNIQNIVRDLKPPQDIIPSQNIGGGWVYWNRKYFCPKIASYEKKWEKGDRAWPLWGQRGICIVMCLYCLVFISGVWRKTAFQQFSIDLKLQKELYAGVISEDLKREFKERDHPLSDNAKRVGDKIIDHQGNEYVLETKGDRVYVYKKEWFHHIENRWVYIKYIIAGLILVVPFILDKVIAAASKGKFLFKIPLECSNLLSKLKEGRIPEDLRLEFERKGWKLSESSLLKKRFLFKKYFIIDEDNERLYSVEKKCRVFGKREKYLRVYLLP